MKIDTLLCFHKSIPIKSRINRNHIIREITVLKQTKIPPTNPKTATFAFLTIQNLNTLWVPREPKFANRYRRCR